MAVSHSKEGTIGLLTYLLIAGAVAVNLVLGALLVGADTVSDRLSNPVLGDWLESGEAFSASAVAFLVFLPFAVLGVSGLMGRRAAMSGNAVRGAAALNALIGVLISWTLFALGLLIASYLGGVDGKDSEWEAITDLVLEGYLFVLIALLPLMGAAALTAGFVKDAFDPGVYARDLMQAGSASETPGPMLAPSAPSSFPVDCPDCSTRFLAEGARPLRIACPTCGKTGTIR